MPIMTVSKDVAGSADAIWALLADFGDVHWIPVAGDVEIEGNGRGMCRKIHGSGDTPVVERLRWIDPDEMRLSYEILNNPLPVDRFEAVVFVAHVPGSHDMSRVGWEVDYDPSGNDADARESIEAVYTMMAGWLADATNKTGD